MPKVNSITLGSGQNATVLIVPRRGKKTWMLEFYSIEGKGIEKQIGLIDVTNLRDKPLFKMKFKNIAGIDSMLTGLNFIRDKAIFEKGWTTASKGNELKEILSKMPIEQFTKVVMAVEGEVDKRFGPSPEKKEEKKEQTQPEAVTQ